MDELREYQEVFELEPTPRQLPKVMLAGELYFVDFRLGELRHVSNPHDVRAMADLTEAEQELLRGQLDNIIQRRELESQVPQD